MKPNCQEAYFYNSLSLLQQLNRLCRNRNLALSEVVRLSPVEVVVIPKKMQVPCLNLFHVLHFCALHHLLLGTPPQGLQQMFNLELLAAALAKANLLFRYNCHRVLDQRIAAILTVHKIVLWLAHHLRLLHKILLKFQQHQFPNGLRLRGFHPVSGRGFLT